MTLQVYSYEDTWEKWSPDERGKKGKESRPTAQKKDFKFDQSFSTVKISHGYN